IPLVREARRLRRLSGNSAAPAPPRRGRSPQGIWGTGPAAAPGTTAVLTDPPESPPVVEAEAPARAAHAGRFRLCAALIAGGGSGIWICVTLLKYFHE